MSLNIQVRILTSLRLVAAGCCLAGGLVAGVSAAAAVPAAAASAGGSSFVAVGPTRVLDTRDGTGTGGVVAPVAHGGQVSLQVDGVAGVPASDVTAVVLNVTVTDTSQGGYITVYPDGTTRPTASNLNFTTGETIANLVVVPVGADGKVDLYNNGGASDLVADLAGYYTTAADTAWGNAIEVPGLAALATGTVYGGVDSVSCPSAGNCAAGGGYSVGPCYSPCTASSQALVVSEVNGVWGDAIEVPGTAALNTDNAAGVSAVSCTSAGNCTAGGDYADSSGNDQVFVADEVNGTWGKAIELPGTASLDTGEATEAYAAVKSVSCGSAGNCAAGGFYADSSGHSQAFVADEVNGIWQNAIEVPGLAALNNGSAGVQSVSCPSAGDCAATGSYADSSGRNQAFVADEVNGVWGTAIEVPGTAALNTGGYSILIGQFDSVSCGSAGNCAVGGDYTDSSGHSQAFVADEVSGVWGDAIEVPGTAALNTGNAYVLSVSCSSAGNCSAGGEYSRIIPPSGSGSSQPFVVSEVNGKWGDAFEVLGGATIANAQLPDLVSSVSCGSPGNCAAGGYYDDSSGYTHAFVVSEVNGTWGEMTQVPGTTVDGYLNSVSCPAAGDCAAVGFAGVGSGGLNQGFLVSQN